MPHLHRSSRRHDESRTTRPELARDLARAEAYAEARRRNPDLFR
jgi:hypothetical protein